MLSIFICVKLYSSHNLRYSGVVDKSVELFNKNFSVLVTKSESYASIDFNNVLNWLGLLKVRTYKPTLSLELKYHSGNPVISAFERVSKPGRRIFSSAESLPKVNNGLGIAIVSTPKGVMTDIDARKQRVGGEIICKVF